MNQIQFFKNIKVMFPPRIELRTFSVLGRRDNHYTMETYTLSTHFKSTFQINAALLLSWTHSRMYFSFFKVFQRTFLFHTLQVTQSLS